MTFGAFSVFPPIHRQTVLALPPSIDKHPHFLAQPALPLIHVVATVTRYTSPLCRVHLPLVAARTLVRQFQIDGIALAALPLLLLLPTLLTAIPLCLLLYF